MTDNEIKENLEDCGCPECMAILALINRQKREFERLEEEKDEWKLSAINKARRVDELTNEIAKLKFSSMIGATRAEAIKEFAERLKEKLHLNDMVMGSNCAFVEDFDIDNLVKEMTEGV